jgi:hypothetical protein
MLWVRFVNFCIYKSLLRLSEFYKTFRSDLQVFVRVDARALWTWPSHGLLTVMPSFSFHHNIGCLHLTVMYFGDLLSREVWAKNPVLATKGRPPCRSRPLVRPDPPSEIRTDHTPTKCIMKQYTPVVGSSVQNWMRGWQVEVRYQPRGCHPTKVQCAGLSSFLKKHKQTTFGAPTMVGSHPPPPPHPDHHVACRFAFFYLCCACASCSRRVTTVRVGWICLC